MSMERGENHLLIDRESFLGGYWKVRIVLFMMKKRLVLQDYRALVCK